MRNISDYINEARSTALVEIEYTPKNRMELIDAIKAVANAQSRQKVLDFNCIDTSAVTDMEEVFYLALSKMRNQFKKDFLVDQWNVSNVESFDYLFSECSGFTGKGIENWNVTSKCKYMNGMFKSTAIEEIDLTRWDLGGLISAFSMFDKVKGLKSVQLPELMPKLDRAYGMFRYCHSLAYVKLPQNILENLRDTRMMFYYSGSNHNQLVVDNLDSIILPKARVRIVKDTCENMFYHCGILPEILKDYVEGQNLSTKDIRFLGIDTDKL